MGSARSYSVLIGPSTHTKFLRVAAFFEQTKVYLLHERASIEFRRNSDPVVKSGGNADGSGNTDMLSRNMSCSIAGRQYISRQVLGGVCFFPI